MRLLSTSFLQSVPFETNSNGSLFDTDILLQAAYASARVEEIAFDNLTDENRIIIDQEDLNELYEEDPDGDLDF